LQFFGAQLALQCTDVELKRLISHFTYRIEPKPEGGFVAHGSEAGVPPIEAATRAELQQKIQSSIAVALGAEFPGLKVPLENKEVNFAFHVEHGPDGGLILQSTDGKELPIVGSTHADIESKLAEKVMGALGQHLTPELAKALAGADSGEVKVVVKRNVRFSLTSRKAGSASEGLRQADNQMAASLNAGGSPVTPEANRVWPIMRLLLLALIVAAIVYFLRHR
jgi:hypothetical protein